MAYRYWLLFINYLPNDFELELKVANFEAI